MSVKKKKTKQKKKKKKKQADLDAVDDGLDVVGLGAQLGLPYFFCPGSDAAAHGPYGLRPNPHCLQVKTQSFSHSDIQSMIQKEACSRTLLA